MQAEQEKIGLALADIAAIRSAINTTRRAQDGTWDEEAYRASSLAQMISLGLCGALLLIEVMSQGYLTLMLKGSVGQPFYKALGTGIVGTFLVMGSSILYFIVWRAAQLNNQTLSDFLKTNFKYLQNISQLGDLFVKFCVFAAFLWADKAEWVPPLLLLFTADYLIQGRLFTLSIKLSLGLGLLYALFAVAQVYTSSPSMFWPLLGFFILQLGSIYFLKTRMKVSSGEAGN